MYQSSFSRQDLFQVSGMMLIVLALAGGFSLMFHPILGFLTIAFFMGLLIFVSDMVAKDMYEPPYFRCEACGNLRPERKKREWNNATICSSCNSDKPSQKSYAISKPMIVKRLRKN